MQGGLAAPSQRKDGHAVTASIMPDRPTHTYSLCTTHTLDCTQPGRLRLWMCVCMRVTYAKGGERRFLWNCACVCVRVFVGAERVVQYVDLLSKEGQNAIPRQM